MRGGLRWGARPGLLKEEGARPNNKHINRGPENQSLTPRLRPATCSSGAKQGIGVALSDPEEAPADGVPTRFSRRPQQ